MAPTGSVTGTCSPPGLSNMADVGTFKQYQDSIARPVFRGAYVSTVRCLP
jgi:hypothetical protein